MSAAACGGGSTAGGSASGELAGVPFGATKEKYVAALSSAEPVTLRFQAPRAPDAATTRIDEAYMSAVEEWSGGKIRFEIAYSGSIAPISKMHEALSTGLVDMGRFLPSAAADAFPLNNPAGRLMSLHDGSALQGSLQMQAAWYEIGVKVPEYASEMRSQGIEPLLAFTPCGGASVACTKAPARSVADFQGKVMRARSPGIAKELEALGATLATVPSPELFEALQRGTIDCGVSSPSSQMFGGVYEVADYLTFDENLVFSAGLAAFGIDGATWDRLPLPMRQLLWVRLDVFMEEFAAQQILGLGQVDAVVAAHDKGVEFVTADKDALDALAAYRAKVKEGVADTKIGSFDSAGLVKKVEDIHARWLITIATELGLSSSLTGLQFATWYEANEPDLSAYVVRLGEQLLRPHRPA